MIYHSESVIKEWENQIPTELQSADDSEKQKRTQLALALGSRAHLVVFCFRMLLFTTVL